MICLFPELVHPVLEWCPRQPCLNVVMNGVSHSCRSAMVQRRWQKYGKCLGVALHPPVKRRFCAQVSQEEKGTPQTNGEKASSTVQHAAEKGKKWLERKGSQRSTMDQVLGNCLHSPKCGAALRMQMGDVAPSYSLPPSAAQHIY